MLARSARALLAAQAKASNAGVAYYAVGNDRSMSDKLRETARDATNTDTSNPSITEKIREGVGKVTEKVGEMFKEDGKVGHQFTPKGAAGGTAQEVGGPFDKEGAVGHEFTTKGSIGGTVERAAETLDDKGEQMQKKAQQNQGKEQMKSPRNQKF
eukprot:GHUV01000067.1.p1 GENE.GHUV01000067.1~~GHUV01000067.1.p1  ORF type:complete len:155 (+),score=41.06 GHUV01000067.1:146-610(+)